MKHAVIATGAALLLAAATLTTSPTPADAQQGRAGVRAGMSGSVQMGGGRAGPSQFSGGVSTRQFSGGVSTPRFNSGGVVSGRHITGGHVINGRHGRHHHFARRHFRGGPFVSFGFASPYFYDYASTYAYSDVYADDECYELRAIKTRYYGNVRYRWVYVCN